MLLCLIFLNFLIYLTFRIIESQLSVSVKIKKKLLLISLVLDDSLFETSIFTFYFDLKINKFKMSEFNILIIEFQYLKLAWQSTINFKNKYKLKNMSL